MTDGRKDLSSAIKSQHFSLSLIDGRTKQLPGYAYKLATGNGYGLDVAFSDTLDIDEKRMALRIPFADGQRRDGVGDLLDVHGIHTERHRANPIVLFDHGKQVSLPIGLAEDPDTKQYTVRIDSVAKTADLLAFFYQGKGLETGIEHGKDDEYDHAILCEQLFDLAAKRYIRAGSIGYQVLQAYELPPEPMMGTPKGLHLQQVLMLEGSLVVMPANQDTVRKALSLPCVCGKPLSPMLVKSLAPYAPEKKAQLGYEEKAREEVFQHAGHRFVIREVPKPFSGGEKVWVVFVDGDSRADSMWPSVEKAKEYIRGEWPEVKSQPSADIDPEKAEQILHDGEVHGEPLTDKQRRMFGSAASRDKDYASDHLQARTDYANPLSRSKVPVPNWKPGRGAKSRLMIVCRGDDGWYVCNVGSNTPEFGPFVSQGIAAVWANRLNLGKNLTVLRKKYSNLKNLRLRRKKSSSGSAYIYVSGKNTNSAREMAESKGVTFAITGSKNGTDRVKLTGEDSRIDEVAKEYGVSLKAVKRRDLLPVKGGTKSMGVKGMEDSAGQPLQVGDRVKFDDFLPGGKRVKVTGQIVRLSEGTSSAVINGDDGRQYFLHARNTKKTKAMQPLRDPASTNVHAGTAQAGETVTARRMLVRIPPPPERPTPMNFASSGDRLEVVEVSGGRMKVRRSDGEMMWVTSNDVRRTKSIGTKALSFPGWDVEANVYIGSGKNAVLLSKPDGTWKAGLYDGNPSGKLEEERTFQDEPSAFAHYRNLASRKSSKGTKSTEAVKFGDLKIGERYTEGFSRDVCQKISEDKAKNTRDGSTVYLLSRDEVYRVKSIKGGNKSMKKDMEETAPDQATEDGGYDTQEPLGAQVLRRLHEDHSLLLQDYDGMLGPLKNERVKARLQKKAESIAEELTEFEEMFGKEYPDLGGLVGMKDDDALEDAADEETDGESDNDKEEYEEELEATPKDMDTMDDVAVASSSEEKEEPTPDEAYEGMERTEGEEEKEEKSFAVNHKKVKSLRRKYGKKDLCPGCNEEPCVCPGETGAKLGPAAAAIPAVAGAVGGMLSSRDKGYIKEAGGFLGELGQPESVLDDEGRMKSYHYHKTLEGIAQLDEARNNLEQDQANPQDNGIPPAEFEPGVGAKGAVGAAVRHPRVRSAARGAVRGAVEGAVTGKAEPGTEEWQREEVQESEHQEEENVLVGASKYFKELSTCQDFGDPHREKAVHYAKQLNDFVGEEEPAEESPEGVVMEETPVEEEPGMEVKFLAEEAVIQNKKIVELSRMLSRLPI